jgi:hypothetical protein
MAVTLNVVLESELPSGVKLIVGKGTLGNNYYTGGDLINFSNHFKAATYPVVTVSGADGYILEHDAGTAAAGKILAYYPKFDILANTQDQNAVPLHQVIANANLSTVTFNFIAAGQPY